MPISYDRVKNPELEMRRRIDALTAGTKPTKAMFQASIAPLIAKIDRTAKLRASTEAVADRNRSAVYNANRRTEKPSERELDALNKYRQAAIATGQKLKVFSPTVQLGASQIRSGSIWVALSTPYTDRWTVGDNAVANHLLGTWSTESVNTNQSLAGICTFFTPVPGRFNVRFAPFVSLSYSFYMNAFQLSFPPSPTVSRASSSGFVGAYVTAWDGSQWVEMADARETLWDRRVSINDEVMDSYDSSQRGVQANFQTVGNPLTFALWAWGGVITSARDGTFGFGHSLARLEAAVPYVIIEQMI